MAKKYDIVIIGAGPAGLAAGLYAGRAKMSALIIEKTKEGGQITLTDEIENYPGSMLDGETGTSLMDRFAAQAKKFGAETVMDDVLEVELEESVKRIVCAGETYEAKAVIIAAGAAPSLMGCPGEEEYTGRGVSYCATCDAVFFEGLDVYVVGGGDAAVEEAIYLTKFARKVTLIHRRDSLRAAKSIQLKAFSNPKMDFIWNSEVAELSGGELLNHMTLRNTETGELTEISADENDGIFGVFVFVGYKPATSVFEEKLEMQGGYIVTDQEMRTNIPGVYAAGDCRLKDLRQVVTAASDGATAAWQAARYIDENE